MLFTCGITLILAAGTLGNSVAPIEGYDVFIPEWEVEISPNGPRVMVNGTIEQVREQMIKINPNWEKDFPTDTHDDGSSDGTSFQNSTDWNTATTYCGGDRWGMASVFRIRKGIDYLRGVRGKPKSGAGPSRCGRVSCSYNAAIWWCNDNDHAMQLNSFDEIAGGARLLVIRCVDSVVPRPKEFVAQAFHVDRWNVIIRKDSC